jgi:hypothetical protein
MVKFTLLELNTSADKEKDSCLGSRDLMEVARDLEVFLACMDEPRLQKETPLIFAFFVPFSLAVKIF